MKFSFILIGLFIINSSGYAHTGLITGLEAPLLQYPNIKAKVLQIKRKGEKIYIAPDPRIPQSPLTIDYNVGQFGSRVRYQFNKKIQFYHTLTRNGVNAYIPASDIKVIHGDSREASNPILQAQGDPRDYRLEEPLPDFYPFSKAKHKRFGLLYTNSNSANTNYNYEDDITDETFSLTHGLLVSWGNKVDFDTSDRFYYGGAFRFNSSNNQIQTLENITANEKHRRFSLGPYASYDVLRTSRYMITFGLGMSFNYHLSLITMADSDTLALESRQFTGLSVSSAISGQFTIRDIIPDTGTDFILGIDSSMTTPYSLRASTQPNELYLWSETDSVDAGISSKITLFIGLQARY